MKKLFLFLILVVGLSLPCWADQVTLTWDHNTESDLAGYNVYRAERFEDRSTGWAKVGTVEAGVNVFTDEVDSGKNYVWIIDAFDLSEPPNTSFVSNMVERFDRTPPGVVSNLQKQE